LAILPARLLDSIPRAELRRAAWNEHPVGNGPFRFVAHEPGRRWCSPPTRISRRLGRTAGARALPRRRGGRADDQARGAHAGEVDFAGIQPAHAAFVRKNPALAVLAIR